MPTSVTCEFPDGTQHVLDIDENDTVRSLKRKALAADPEKVPVFLRKSCVGLRLEGGDADVFKNLTAPLAGLPLEADSKVQIRVSLPTTEEDFQKLVGEDAGIWRFDEGVGAQWWSNDEGGRLTTITKTEHNGETAFVVFFGTHDMNRCYVNSDLIGVFDTWEEALMEAVKSDCDEDESDSKNPAIEDVAQWWNMEDEGEGGGQQTTIKKAKFQGNTAFIVFYCTHDYKPGHVSSGLIGVFDTSEEARKAAVKSAGTDE